MKAPDFVLNIIFQSASRSGAKDQVIFFQLASFFVNYFKFSDIK